MKSTHLLLAALILPFHAAFTVAQDAPAEDQIAPEKTEAEDAKPVFTPGTSVKLLEEGEEPRHELRYNATGEFQFVLSTKAVSEQSIMGMRPPATRIPDVRFTIEAVAEASEGEALRLQLRIAEVEVVPDPDVPPPVLQVTQRNVSATKGRTAVLIANDRGVVQSMTMSGPAMRPGAMIMGDTVEIMRDALRTAMIALPEEPVGVGARWQVKSKRQAGGVEMTERIEYRIRSIEDDTVHVAVETFRSATEQELQMPGSPQTMKLRSFESTGSGRETITLARLIPVESQREDKADMEIVIAGPGGMHTMLQTIQSWITIGAKQDVEDAVEGDDAPPQDRE